MTETIAAAVPAQTAAKKASPLKLIREYFGMNLADMKKEWTNGGLSADEKAQLVAGIENGSMTY